MEKRKENKYSGGLIDDRKVNKDYSHLEIGFSTPVKWLSKSEAKKVERKYEKRNQETTMSCGGHAGELSLSIDTGTIHEPAFIYRMRKNYPSEGMYHYDIGDILHKLGACEYLGIEKTEKDYNAYYPTSTQFKEATSFAGASFIVLEDNAYTIDDIAQIVNTLHRPLILFVYWNGKEWSSSTPVAKGNLLRENAQYRHYVVVLPDSAYQVKKKKYVIIQDSAWFGGKNIRHLSEDWINKRTYTGLYFMNLRATKLPYKYTQYEFTRNLKMGDRGEDVKMLQTILQEMGFFPINISPTEYFGGITRQAVKDFQEKYRSWILAPLGLDKPTGIFGKSTRKKLNELIKY